MGYTPSSEDDDAEARKSVGGCARPTLETSDSTTATPARGALLSLFKSRGNNHLYFFAYFFQKLVRPADGRIVFLQRMGSSYKKKIRVFQNKGRELKQERDAEERFVNEKKQAALHEAKQRDRLKLAAKGPSAVASLAPPAAGVEALMRKPKVALEKKPESISHLWREAGPMGLKLKAVSTVSLDAPEGVYVDAVTIEAVPAAIAGMRIAEVIVSTGERRTGLVEQSYTEVLSIIKSSGRPVTIEFHSPGYEPAAALDALSLAEGTQEGQEEGGLGGSRASACPDGPPSVLPKTGLTMVSITDAGFLPENSAGQKKGHRGEARRGPPRGGYDTGPGLYD